MFERGNVVTTSARRLERGLVYTVLVSFFVYYFLAYLLNRMSARRTFGNAPAIRYPRIRRPSLRRPGRTALLGMTIIGLAVASLMTGAGSAAFASLSGFWNRP